MERQLLLRVIEDEADAQRVEELARVLQQELLELDVDDVEQLRGGPVPPGARAIDVAAVGALLVTLGQSVASLKTVLSAVRSWLSRSAGSQRTVKIEMGGDVLELTAVGAAEQQRLIELFVNRHAAAEGEQWIANGKP
jgi:hypothetical protein